MYKVFILDDSNYLVILKKNQGMAYLGIDQPFVFTKQGVLLCLYAWYSIPLVVLVGILWRKRTSRCGHMSAHTHTLTHSLLLK